MECFSSSLPREDRMGGADDHDDDDDAPEGRWGAYAKDGHVGDGAGGDGGGDGQSLRHLV